jgi:hypothetical protein
VNAAGTGPAAPSCDSGHTQIMAGPYAYPADFLARRRVAA